MNRMQKKCLVFSLALHGLLAVILLGSAAFGERPEAMDIQVLSMIPANILDRAESGGGEAAAATVAPQPLQPQPAPQPQPTPQPQPVVQPQPRAVATQCG